MRLRASRVHEVGKSNADFRPQHYERMLGVGRTDFLAIHKQSPKHVSEVIKSKSTRSAHPIEMAEDFYRSTDLQIKEKAILRTPFQAHLEEKDKFKIFNGDSNIFEERKIQYGYIKPRKPFISKTPLATLENDKLVNDKHEKHASAIAETQLVGIEKKDTLDGKIDLDNVREIRKALRRRYANRTNFQKIFSSWDTDSSGCITARKMHEMINKMQIKINMDEARVLVASADENMQGYLNMDQFMYLIFNGNDALNVDLKKMPVLSEKEMEEVGGKGKVVELLAGDILKVKNERKEKQLNVILKNKLEAITNLVLMQDELSSGFIPYEKLEIAIKKVGFPQSVLGDSDIRQIFDKYKINEHKFDYKKFISFLKSYNFVLEDLQKPDIEEEEICLKKNSEKNKLLHQQILSVEQPIQIIDSHEQNSWQLELIRNKANKVFKKIHCYFTSKQELEDFISKQMPNKQLGDAISKSELTKFFKDVFLSIGERDLSQNDLEGFLSAFRYNKQGYTPISEIAPLIYEETDNQWLIRMPWKKHRPPPPINVLYDEDFPKEVDENNKTGNIYSLENSMADVYNDFRKNKIQYTPNKMEASIVKNQSSYDLRSPSPLKESFPQRFGSQNMISLNSSLLSTKIPKSPDNNKEILKESKGNTRYSSFYQQGSPTSNKVIKEILSKIENRIFVGSTKAQEVFRSFDLDKDGYVSQKDMVGKIKQLGILDPFETKTLLQYIDPLQKGFLNFQEFSSKITSGMTVNTYDGHQIVPSTILPNSEKNEFNKLMLPTIKSKIDLLRTSFRPEQFSPNSSMMKKTRFGATPFSRNTYQNVEAMSQSSMFCNEQERFDTRENHRIKFQAEEKEKKLEIINFKAQRLRTINENLSQKIEDQFQKSQTFINEKIKLKGYKQWAYEHRAHLLNDWS